MPNRPGLRVSLGRPLVPDQKTRKVVTAEILLARAFARPLGSEDGRSDALRVKRVVKRVRDAARCLDTLGNSRSLGEHLREALGCIRAEAGSEGTPARMVAEFACEINEIPAEEMGDDDAFKRTWHVSSWSCIQELFDYALQAVQADYNGLVLPGVPVEVEAKLFLRGRSHGREVTAATVFPDADGVASRSAEVVVEIPWETFGGGDYFGLLAKLHHELFIHSVQAIDHPDVRECYGERCPLTEGYMDRAAHRSLLSAIAQRPFRGRTANIGNRFRTECESLHSERFKPADPSALDGEWLTANARILGRDLFDHLVALRGSGPEAEHWAIQLGMQLNLRAYSGVDRRALIQRIHARLHGTAITRDRMMTDLSEIVLGADPYVLLGRTDPICAANALLNVGP